MRVADFIVSESSVVMPFFGVLECIGSTVLVPSTMAMTVVVEKKETSDVGNQTQTSNYQHKLRARDCLRLGKSLYSFQDDAYAQGDQEDAIDKRTQCLCSLPLYRYQYSGCQVRTHEQDLLTPYVYILELGF